MIRSDLSSIISDNIISPLSVFDSIIHRMKSCVLLSLTKNVRNPLDFAFNLILRLTRFNIFVVHISKPNEAMLVIGRVL